MGPATGSAVKTELSHHWNMFLSLFFSVLSNLYISLFNYLYVSRQAYFFNVNKNDFCSEVPIHKVNGGNNSAPRESLCA